MGGNVVSQLLTLQIHNGKRNPCGVSHEPFSIRRQENILICVSSESLHFGANVSALWLKICNQDALFLFHFKFVCLAWILQQKPPNWHIFEEGEVPFLYDARKWRFERSQWSWCQDSESKSFGRVSLSVCWEKWILQWRLDQKKHRLFYLPTKDCLPLNVSDDFSPNRKQVTRVPWGDLRFVWCQWRPTSASSKAAGTCSTETCIVRIPRLSNPLWQRRPLRSDRDLSWPFILYTGNHTAVDVVLCFARFCERWREWSPFLQKTPDISFPVLSLHHKIHLLTPQDIFSSVYCVEIVTI